MAEVAAGLVVAEEVVSTTVQAGAATYAVAKPTMPLKATFTQIAAAKDEETRQALTRSDHSVTIIKDKAYIFGGVTTDGELASNEIHSVDFSSNETPSSAEYALLPANPDIKDQPVPSARTKHAACHFNVCLAVFGGQDASGALVDQDPVIWLYVTGKSAWETIRSQDSSVAPVQRYGASLFNASNNLVLYGGFDKDDQPLKDVWHFSYTSKSWTALPSAPVDTSNAAYSDGSLYLISSADTMSSEVHALDISNPEKPGSWTTTTFPTNPLAPGPRPRVGGGLLPISTGYGRNYLLYFFGARQDPATNETSDPEETSAPTQWSDAWTYQAPSTKPAVRPTRSISEALKPSAIKDAIREKLGYDSGEKSWCEVEVKLPEILGEGDGQGKIHPGPRMHFGCDFVGNEVAGAKVVIWGGVNAKGDREGDGWVISLE
ncbi:unnamed protein product [Zymoseptoria tritici ST99CH_3D1]|nr:unnamed protein product [Zymoseptoria tritici ST99CH_3D1]